MGPALLIFFFTYILIGGRRLSLIPIGRPAGALAGACAMVVLGLVSPSGLTPGEAFAAVEPNTIGLLLGMMLLAASLAEAGIFEWSASWVVARRLSPVKLLYVVTLGAGVLSALLLNDSVCLLFAPLVDATARRSRLPRIPYLLALAMGSNAGSAMTLAGNPQNMLIAHLSGISYSEYLLRAGPAGLLALLATAAMLHAMHRTRLRSVPSDPGEAGEALFGGASLGDAAPPSTRAWVPVICVVAVSVAFAAGANLAWASIAGAAVVMLLRGRDSGPLFSRVSWTVLVFFAALFILVAGLQKAGVPRAALEAAAPHLPRNEIAALGTLSLALVVGCQIISNVPFILLIEPMIKTLPDPVMAWTVAAVVSTLAGNLTLLGSVANIIVVESAGAEKDLGFRAYVRVGAPVTLVSTMVALGWLWLTMPAR